MQAKAIFSLSNSHIYSYFSPRRQTTFHKSQIIMWNKTTKKWFQIKMSHQQNTSHPDWLGTLQENEHISFCLCTLWDTEHRSFGFLVPLWLRTKVMVIYPGERTVEFSSNYDYTMFTKTCFLQSPKQANFILFYVKLFMYFSIQSCKHIHFQQLQNYQNNKNKYSNNLYLPHQYQAILLP